MPTITPRLAHLVQGAKGEGIEWGGSAQKKMSVGGKKGFQDTGALLSSEKTKKKGKKKKNQRKFFFCNSRGNMSSAA